MQKLLLCKTEWTKPFFDGTTRREFLQPPRRVNSAHHVHARLCGGGPGSVGDADTARGTVQRGVIASIRGRANCLFMFDNPSVRMRCAGGADTALPIHWRSLGLPDAAAAAAFRARQPGIRRTRQPGPRRAKQAGAAAAFRIPYPAGVRSLLLALSEPHAQGVVGIARHQNAHERVVGLPLQHHLRRLVPQHHRRKQTKLGQSLHRRAAYRRPQGPCARSVPRA